MLGPLHLLLLLEAASSPPVAEAGRATVDIRVDGRLDEAAWEDAPVHEAPRQKSPRAGAPASQRTYWRALAGRDALYLGIRCEHDPTTPVVARLTRRDRAVESDRVTIDLDTRGRDRDAFHFEVTAGGSLVDGIRYNDTSLDLQWDGLWDAAVQQDDGGWTAEVEIPYRLLRRPPGTTEPVSIQIRRYVSVLGETDEWAPTPRDSSLEVSRYGSLHGFDLPARRVSAEVIPYISAGTEVESGTSSPPTMIRRGGGDVKLRAGADLTLDAAIYPDFGNVEADTAVFNLQAVEVQFPEKRPFLLEGADVLATPLGVFYSRRIGSLTGTTTGTVLEAPPPAPVLGAAKLLARVGDRWSLATLAATTQFQDVRVRNADAGIEGDQRVSPTYTYGAVRARRDLRNAGFIGLMATARGSFDQGPRDPWPACPDGQQPDDGACFADVYALSGDASIRSAGGRWVGTTQVVGTFRHGGTPAADLDGNTLESGDIGPAVHAKVEKKAGRLIGYAHYEYLGKDADWNATGFLPLPNRHLTRAHFAVQELVPHGPVLEDRWQLEVFHNLSLDGVPLGSGYQVNYSATWKSFWFSFTELHWRPSHFDNREARDGTPVERAGLIGWEQVLRTDHRRALAGTLDGEYQQRENGPHVEGELAADWNVISPLQIRLALNGIVDRGEPRWLETDADAGVYRLARLDAAALGFILRANYTVTPKLELQAYGQLLGVVTDYREGFVAPLGVDRIHLDALLPDPAFSRFQSNEALLVANLFLRWEYALGSNLYLVLTRNQLDPTEAGEGGHLDYLAALRNPAAYVFLVKTTILLGR